MPSRKSLKIVSILGLVLLLSALIASMIVASANGSLFTDQNGTGTGQNGTTGGKGTTQPALNASPQASCTPPPSGLVAWYPGDGNANDIQGGNNGTRQGNVTFVNGKVNQAFSLGGHGDTNGNGDRVLVGNPASLRLQDLTIEGYIKRASSTIVTNNGRPGVEGGTFFAYGNGGYGFLIDQATGRIGLTKVENSVGFSTTTITDTNYHHVAVTKSGSTVTFYIDGVADTSVSYNPGFTFTTPAAIGARGDNDVNNAFFGDIDELSIYNRALSQTEIQAIVNASSAGKCKSAAAILSVTNTNDSDAGSLRQAILDSNANSGTQTISFNIPGTGVQTINLFTALPSITDPVVIDGYTQPNATANTLSVGDNANLLIELNGANAGEVSNGLRISADNCTVRGLVINRFGNDGIRIFGGSNNHIEGNFIGTNATGTAALANGRYGVDLAGGAGRNGHNSVGSKIDVVGGAIAVAERNIISGNSFNCGVAILDSGTIINLIAGNYIGTNAAGTSAIANNFGVCVDNGPQSNVVGSYNANAGNVISGNTNNGVFISGAGTANIGVTANLIGTDATGNSPLPNGTGGIIIVGGAHGNFIGVAQTSLGGNGVGNTIAYNGGDGVQIDGSTTNGDSILSNLIFSNAALGIHLTNGANRNLAAPVITSTSYSGGVLHVVGTATGTPNVNVKLQIFANSACDPSGSGEGQSLLNTFTVATDGSGNGTFDQSFFANLQGQTFITATTTDYANTNDTSQFSQCAQILTFTLSGRVVDGTGTGVSRVTVNLYATQQPSTAVTTDPDGNYSFSNLSNDSYTVSPSQSGYFFTPSQRYVTINGSNAPGQDFVRAPNPSISGRIVDANNVGISGVTIRLNGQSEYSNSFVTGSDGSYSFTDLQPNQTYTINPSKVDFYFTPPARTYRNLNSQITNADFTGSPAITSPGKIAFISYNSNTGVQSIYVVDGHGRNRTQVSNTDGAQSVNWSPGGTKLVFQRYTDGTGGIYTINADGTNPKQLTIDPNDSYPSWSPDGTRIAFSRSATNADIYVMNAADGSNLQNLTNTASNESTTTWSADSTKIAYSYNDGNTRGIGVLNATDGSNQTLLTSDGGSNPDWSPDGTKIAYDKYDYPNGYSIIVMNADGSSPVNLSQNSPGASINNPSWSPDNARLAVEGNSGIKAIKANGSQLASITDNSNDYAPAWQRLSAAQLQQTFIVSTTLDSGPGSLRQAIMDANAVSGTDTIAFSIDGTGITISSALPDITDPVIIDGTTQPGYSGTPLIELDGTNAGTPTNGLSIFAGNSTVRGLVINRFTGAGILLRNGGGNNIQGNYIGTNSGGTAASGNGDSGVEIYDSSNNTIGGTTTNARNVISGNRADGVEIATGGPLGVSNGNVVQGNYIGTDIAGTGDIRNFGAGVSITNGFNNVIGAALNNPVAGSGNIIGFNGVTQTGVHIHSGTGNSVLSNSIFSSVGLGIDLGDDFVTQNDPGDADVGANNLQNFPVLTSASFSNNVITVQGTLNSTPGTTFRLEFFGSPAGNPSGYGEGQFDRGAENITTDANGNASFTHQTTALSGGGVITATATDPSGNTSEFSAYRQVTTVLPQVDVQITKTDSPDPATVGSNLTYTLQVTNGPAPSGTPDDTNVVVSDSLPTGVTFNSATATQGSCTQSNGTVTCSLGTLGFYSSATVTINVTPTAAGTITNTATVTSDNPDSNSANNSATATTTVQSAPIIVTNTNDSGTGSLREAILTSNASTGTKETIAFNIPVPSSSPPPSANTPRTITPLSALPTISDPVIIDGTTQPGYAGTPIIELNGTSAGGNGLTITAGNSTVRGLAINRFSLNGIQIQTNGGNTIAGCYIGTNTSGTSALANGQSGITIQTANNIIGGTTAGAGNLISGNSNTGLQITTNAGIGNVVQGNFIGTDVTGTSALKNTNNGVQIFFAGSNNLIGGTSAAARNIVSGNGLNGVAIQSSSGNTVQGNYIGTNAAGTARLPNINQGVNIGTGNNNLIGGTVAGAGNVISGNNSIGIGINNANTTGNKVQGNLIGTNAAGTAALANSQGGISIAFSVDQTTIGGDDAADGTVDGVVAARNVISGNVGNGVAIQQASNTTVQGNYIGTNPSGTAALANTGSGVSISGAATNNTIGGMTTGARNVISGNGSNGVGIANTTGNKVQGNYIGTKADGASALANAGSGVGISGGAAANTVGGTTTSAGNVISGNNSDGVQMISAGTTGNIVQGNLLGTDASGTAAVPNAFRGVSIFSSASANIIGGTVAGARNIISGNAQGGIYIAASSSNKVQGNYIGLQINGTTALANTTSGIFILSGASQNLIGGDDAADGTVDGIVAARNIISGNSVHGITTDNSNQSIVAGNYIGTNAAGTAALPNGQDGIRLNANATNTTIGGTTAGARNLVSGNGNRGVIINGAGATGNTVVGNYIGTNALGNGALPNVRHGVILSVASNNRVGGTEAGASNVISGNGQLGVGIFGDGTTAGIVVQGNVIGLAADGSAALGNGASGIQMSDTVGALIGGASPAARNIISANGRGIALFTSPNITTSGNLVQGNFIGTDASGEASRSNNGDGIALNSISGVTVGGSGAAFGNRIAFNSGTGVSIGSLILANPDGTTTTSPPGNNNNIQFNSIFSNGGSGVLVEGTGNAVRANSIFSNGGLGIDLSPTGVTPNDTGDADTGANNLQNYPVVTSVVASGGNATAQGTLNSAASTAYQLEFFSNPTCDPSGNGEGQTFVGSQSVTTDANGNANFNISLANVSTGQFITATATDPNGNTSEFSACRIAAAPVPQVDLQITKTGVPDPVAVGSALTYTLQVNNGPAPSGTPSATNVIVSDSLPKSVTFNSVSTTQGTCLQGNGTVTCNLGTLGVNGSATVTISVTPTVSGTITNTATVTSDNPDSNTANNSATASTTVQPAATPTPTPTPVCVAPPSGMVAWYPGDGNANDIQGGDNGTPQGGATFGAGKVGWAFSFNGVDAYVQAPANSAQDPTTAGSQDAWVMFNQLPSTAGHIMEIVGKGGGGTDFDLQADTDNRFRFYIAGGNNVASTTVIQTGIWYHVAGTWDATGLRMYVNGVLENTNSIQNLTRGQSGNPLQIGNQPTFGPRLFNGIIDEVEIFNRALTSQEVASIFNADSAGKCKTTPTPTPSPSPTPTPSPTPSPSPTPAATFTIAGRVTDANNAGISSVTVTLTGSKSRSATTDSNGSYSFADLAAGGNYTVMVARTNFTFSPTSRSFSNLQSNQTASFAGALANLSARGRVTDAKGNPIPDVDVVLSGAGSQATKTDAAGNYSFTTIVAGRTYTVTPSKDSYTFAPTNSVLSNFSSDNNALNFVGTFDPNAPPFNPSEGFDGNQRDPTKFNLGTLTTGGAAFDPLVTVTQVNGTLQITPRAGVDDASFNGYVSVRGIDLTEVPTIGVEVVQPATGDGAQTIFGAGNDANTFYRFIVTNDPSDITSINGKNNLQTKDSSASTQALNFQSSLNGTKFATNIPYSPVAHRFWRLRL